MKESERRWMAKEDEGRREKDRPDAGGTLFVYKRMSTME